MDGSMMRLRDIESRLPPGFRFHPSDEELVCYYLRGKVATGSSQQLIVSSSLLTMVEVDLRLREPWDLPVAAKLGDKEWYFFSSRDRKYATGSRTNRATTHGYWKATGKDKLVHEHGMMVGMRKTLVFYFGRAPNGRKSDWVMHEFRLATSKSAAETPPLQEDWVLCRVFHKGKKGDANHGGGGNENLVDMITSPPALCSPSQPADNNLYFVSQLFPPIMSGWLLGDYDHGDLVMGQDAMPDPAAMIQRAAANDGFVEFSEWPDATAQMEDMERVVPQQQGGYYFPCT